MVKRTIAALTATVLSGCAAFPSLPPLPSLAEFGPFRPIGVTMVENFDAWLPRWAAAVESGDTERVVSLYAPQAVLISADTQVAARGIEPVRAYMQRLRAAGADRSVACSSELASRPAENMAVVAGLCQWSAAPGARRAGGIDRVTMTLVRTGGQWLIASQHLSAVAR